jgi:hypothetical protein
MDKRLIVEISNKVLDIVIQHYGLSNHHNETPYLIIEDTPYSDSDDKELIGEYCMMMNELVVYWKNITDVESLIRTIVHEYQHYLQSPSWFTRYYNMGYHYGNHPYEVAAYKEEEYWKQILTLL